MTRTPDDIVRTEVHYCISSLVSTLAAGYGATAANSHLGVPNYDLLTLVEQASELAAPIDDWEQPLLENGWSRVDQGAGKAEDFRWVHQEDIGPIGLVDAQSACEEAGLDPYQREVFEYWIISDWLADQLEAQGEKVDKDFAGLTVWARTTTGQGIASDSVIETIAAKLNAEI